MRSYATRSTTRPSARRLAALVATAALSAASLAACGSSDGDSGSGSDSSDFTSGSGQDIADAATAAMKKLDSVHVAGGFDSDGQKIELDVSLSRSGDCTGTFGTGGGTAQIVSVGGKSWFKPDEAFWKATAGDSADQIIATVGDKWVSIDAGDDSFDEVCDLDSLLKDLSDDTDATFVKGKTSKIGDDEAIAIARTDEEDGDSTGYVKVDGDHYLLKLEKTTGDEQGAVTFDAFDEDVDATAPADEDSISESAIG